MSTMPQHEFHPDAEVLNAFAEQKLDEHERSQVFAHLAICRRCRQVLALVQRAAEVDAEEMVPVAASIAAVAALPAPVPVAAPVIMVRHRPWWQNWKIGWIPVAAFAVSVSFAVYLHIAHLQHAAELARNTSPAMQPDGISAPSAPQSNSNAPSATSTSEATGKAQAQPPVSLQPVEHTTAPLPLPEVAAALPPPAPQAKSPQPTATEAVAAAQNANSPETTSAQQLAAVEPRQLAQAEVLQGEGAGPNASTAKKQLKIESKAQLSDTVGEVSANSAQDHTVFSAGSALTRSPRSASTSAARDANSSDAANRQKAVPVASSMAALGTLHGAQGASAFAASPIHLPSGLAVASLVSANHLLLALDKGGTLFVSADAAYSWQQVAPQWSGRAVLIRAKPPEAPPAAAAPSSVASPSAQQAPPPSATVFEIVNDQHGVWESTDGITWATK